MTIQRPTTRAPDPQTQRRDLLDNTRKANREQPRNFKQDALDDKVVHVEPDGTGPTPTETFDAGSDQQAGSGSGTPESGAAAGAPKASAKPPR